MYQAFKRSIAQGATGNLTLREKIQYSVFGLLLAGGLTIAGRKIYKKVVAGNEQAKTYEEGSPATYAKQIKMAFENDGWWGTDKEALRSALRAIPSQSAFKQAMASYKKLYNANLLADMQDELKSTEYNEMLSIIAAKPASGSITAGSAVTDKDLQEWAKRLKAAFDIDYAGMPGTDEDAIKAVFVEIPTQGAYSQVAATYNRLFGQNLAEDLKSELEFWEYSPMLQIINGKPKN